MVPLSKQQDPDVKFSDSLTSDLAAGLVVFLVATPLCLGIALASGAPFMSGLIAGMIGGIVVPLISRSQLSVSGPAAGLTAVVLLGIEKVGSFEAFLVCIMLAGLLQILLGALRAGLVAYYFPSAVIKGMLAAIGLILIIKQLPVAIGYDEEVASVNTLKTDAAGNLLDLFAAALEQIQWGAVIISLISLALLIYWEYSDFLKKLKFLPGALVAVLFSVLLNAIFQQFAPKLSLESAHLVSLPLIRGPSDFIAGLTFPDFSKVAQLEVLSTAFTIGLIASIETLLTIEAVDKLDPWKRKSPLNRELIAQGTGNFLSGLIGGIPITSVIVRSSAGINAGARTKLTAFFHGIFLLLAVVFLAKYLSMVPMASLAAILLIVGYKLAQPSIFKRMLASGPTQFVPFVVTVVAILVTDLLKGVGIGLVVGLIFVLRTNFHAAVKMQQKGNSFTIIFNHDVSFLNKPALVDALERIEPHSTLTIDGAKATFIDHDILELVYEFKKEAQLKHIEVVLKDMDSLGMSKKEKEQFDT